jgi:transposase
MTTSFPIDAPAACGEHATLFVAFELGKAKWHLGIVVPGSGKVSRYVVEGGDVEAAWRLIGKARERAARKVGGLLRVVSCYEAGYDGFWLHRWLVERGVESFVLDPASLPVDRRERRAKTDRLDLERLISALMRHEWGDPLACRMVHVPSVAQEDDRRPWRERERLIKERTAHTNRIKGLLHNQGVRDAMPRAKQFGAWLATVQSGDGHALPSHLVAELRREHGRLMMVEEQIGEIEAQAEAARRAAAPAGVLAKINQLIGLKSVGPVSSQTLVGEVFYRDFENRRQVGSYFGLTGTPFDSGASRREQGISKAGNPRARTAAIELAWLWRRNQPGSALSRWYEARVGDQKGRVRRIAIVALARKLMVALWRFLEHGIVPEGAVLRAPSRA